MLIHRLYTVFRNYENILWTTATKEFNVHYTILYKTLYNNDAQHPNITTSQMIIVTEESLSRGVFKIG